MKKEFENISKLKKKDKRLERLEKRYVVFPVLVALLGFTLCSFNINLILNLISIVLIDVSVLVPAIFHYDIIGRIKSKRTNIAKQIEEFCKVENEQIVDLSSDEKCLKLKEKYGEKLINKIRESKSVYEKEKVLEEELLKDNSDLDNLSEEEISNILGE